MKFIPKMNYVFDQIAKLLFIIIVLLVFIAAITRKIGFPIAWSIESASLLFGWVVFLGADMALRANGHIGIDYITSKFPVKLQRVILIINYLMMLVFLVIICGYGVFLCIVNVERQLDIIPISNSFATACVPFGSLLMSITIIRKIISLIKREDLNKKFNSYNFIKGEEEAC